MKGYQLKLDFGEGQECHALYEEYIKETGKEDTISNWLTFIKCYQMVEAMKVMQEKESHTIQ